jgi:hypothetical protein
MDHHPEQHQHDQHLPTRNHPNVGKYTIHGAYGIYFTHQISHGHLLQTLFFRLQFFVETMQLFFVFTSFGG